MQEPENQIYFDLKVMGAVILLLLATLAPQIAYNARTAVLRESSNREARLALAVIEKEENQFFKKTGRYSTDLSELGFESDLKSNEKLFSNIAVGFNPICVSKLQPAATRSYYFSDQDLAPFVEPTLKGLPTCDPLKTGYQAGLVQRIGERVGLYQVRNNGAASAVEDTIPAFTYANWLRGSL